ncbi:MAG TPA: pimeloyl-ACP methyl ester esterase BioH [Casimicrobiaceae bacterium]|nr:pimeloyl-ACP methyl ester esterase BioH [Casimicrobiaceae bacterium]
MNARDDGLPVGSRDGRLISACANGVHVETTGAGSPLVLIHGFAMQGGVFAPLVPALALRHRVHVMDLPGHGASAPIEPYDLPALADALHRATVDQVEPLAILGWSLGGMVALEFARTRPGRVRSLVLVATTPSFVTRPDWPNAMAPATLARFGDELRVAYRATLLRFLTLQVQGSDEGRRTLGVLRERLFAGGDPDPRQLDAALRLLRDADLRPSLPSVRVPALVIGGARDALVPLAATKALATALPFATHRTIEGAAHAPFLSHPAAFAAALEGFGDG